MQSAELNTPINSYQTDKPFGEARPPLRQTRCNNRKKGAM